MQDKEIFFLAPSETIESKADKKLWYWQECMEIAAKSGAKLGTDEFWVIYKIAVYEEKGRFGFCTAGSSRLADDLGLSEQRVKTALTRACSSSVWRNGEKVAVKPKLYHIYCDKRIYRNKTDIYVTQNWLEKHHIQPDKIGILAHNKRPEQMLSQDNGEYKIIEAENVEERVIKDEQTNEKTTLKSVETTFKNVETTFKNVVGIEVDLNRNKYKGISKSNTLSKDKGSEAPKVVKIAGLEALEVNGKLRVVDKNGEVSGGSPYTEKAYIVWEEIMGFPLKRDKWNSQAGYNMVRAKDKGAEWLAQMLVICKEAKSDSKADFRVKNISNLSDLQKNWEYVVDYARQKALKNSKQNVVKLF